MDAVPNQLDRPRRARPDAPVDVSLGMLPAVAAVVALAVPLAVVGVVLAAVLPGIAWWVGLLLALGVAIALVLHRLRRAHAVVADRLTDTTSTITSVRLSNMVRGLALAAGVEEPEAFVIKDAALNAVVVARNDESTIAVTSGLMDAIEPVELEGVVAELLVRVRNGDAEAATIGSALFRLPILGPLSMLMIGPIAQFGQDRLLDDGRYVSADIEAVGVTRYPPGLLGALTKARKASHRVAGVDEGLDLLWFVDPADNSSNHSQAIRSALDLRIDVLTEL